MDLLTIKEYSILTFVITILVGGWKIFLMISSRLYIKKTKIATDRIVTPNPYIHLFRVILILSAIVLAFFALNKTKSDQIESVNEYNSADIFFLVDVSLSMNSIDIKPNRLKRFQDLMNYYLPKLKGNRLGIVVFAGQAFSYCPLTTDIPAVSDYISSLGIEMVGSKGSDLATAIEKLNKTLSKNSGTSDRIVVIVSDGEDHENKKIPNIDAKVIVWGVGTEEGGPIEYRDLESKKGGYVTSEGGLTDDQYSSQVIISKLNIMNLATIAENNNGEYYNISFDSEPGEKLIESIDKLKKAKIKTLESYQKEEGAFPFLFFALICLLVERTLFLFPKKNFDQSIKFLILIILFLNLNAVYAWELDPGGNATEKSLEFYNKQDYTKSLEELEKAKSYIGEDPKIDFNKIPNLYKQGKYAEAIKQAEKIVSNPSVADDMKSKSYFNMGNSYFRMGDKKNALNSYLKSLELNPNYLAAKKNIEHLGKETKQNAQNKEEEKKESKPEAEKKNSHSQNDKNKENADKIMEPFSNDSILKNKQGNQTNDNEKFW
ncbi:VWA domain-containing protein [Leptospira sp. 96542]|nr:VWA domain-containing protein [Leptospira sp. 96542]